MLAKMINVGNYMDLIFINNITEKFKHTFVQISQIRNWNLLQMISATSILHNILFVHIFTIFPIHRLLEVQWCLYANNSSFIGKLWFRCALLSWDSSYEYCIKQECSNVKTLWAASWQNQQNDLCAQPRLRSSWISTQSDHSLCCLLEES